MTHTLERSLVLEEIVVEGYEKVIVATDESVGLKAIICLHNTVLGPALGGTRIYPYATFEEALEDVKRLSRGMTYKSALADCSWGGGKSVIIADPRKDKTEELLLAFGTAVNLLKGEYICAEDVGSTPEDMLTIAKATPYVVGLPHHKSSGNPSPFTAWGTFRGIQSVLKKLTGSVSLEGKKIALQGLGSVGTFLAEMLFWAGARLIVTDIDKKKVQEIVKRFSAKAVPPEEIFGVECDVFSPCAMGGIIQPKNIAKMRCKAIAGSANNQLLKDSDANLLLSRNILYAPDFVINSGGLINVSQELCPQGYDPQKARDKTDKIFDELLAIYAISEKSRISTQAAALVLGDYRLSYGLGKRETPPHFHHASESARS